MSHNMILIKDFYFNVIKIFLNLIIDLIIYEFFPDIYTE